MYFSDEAMETFEDENPNVIYPIGLEDVVLSCNGVLCTGILLIQHFLYRVRISYTISVIINS